MNWSSASVFTILVDTVSGDLSPLSASSDTQSDFSHLRPLSAACPAVTLVKFDDKLTQLNELREDLWQHACLMTPEAAGYEVTLLSASYLQQLLSH